jgi:hypothetical protein
MPDAVPQSAEGGEAELEATETVDGSDGRGECADARRSAAGSEAKQAAGGASSAAETAVAESCGSASGGGGPGASGAPGAEVRVRECVYAYILL